MEANLGEDHPIEIHEFEGLDPPSVKALLPPLDCPPQLCDAPILGWHAWRGQVDPQHVGVEEAQDVAGGSVAFGAWLGPAAERR